VLPHFQFFLIKKLKMCDESALNIKFVEYVEQYPCIYDFTRDDHSKRNATEKAWNAIGKEFKLSGMYILFILKL